MLSYGVMKTDFNYRDSLKEKYWITYLIGVASWVLLDTSSSICTVRTDGSTQYNVEGDHTVSQCYKSMTADCCWGKNAAVFMVPSVAVQGGGTWLLTREQLSVWSWRNTGALSDTFSTISAPVCLRYNRWKRQCWDLRWRWTSAVTIMPWMLSWKWKSCRSWLGNWRCKTSSWGHGQAHTAVCWGVPRNPLPARFYRESMAFRVWHRYSHARQPPTILTLISVRAARPVLKPGTCVMASRFWMRFSC